MVFVFFSHLQKLFQLRAFRSTPFEEFFHPRSGGKGSVGFEFEVG